MSNDTLPAGAGAGAAEVPCRRCPLRRLEAFAANTDAEIDFIQKFKSGELLLPARTVLREEGAFANELYTLLEGWAFRYRTLTNGNRQIINFLLPGDFIGLQEKLTAHSPHGVELLTAARLCRFPTSGLFDLYREHPSLGYDVTWIAAHEELIVDENLVSVGQRTALQRIAMLLVHLYKRATAVGLKEADGTVPLPITQQHMADALGLSLVHTNKTLRRLLRTDICELKDGRLRLRNLGVIERLADYNDLPLKGRPLI